MRQESGPFVLAAVLCSGALLAQRHDGTLPTDLASGRIPIHSAPDDPLGGAYGLWAAAASYKASFHGDMTFVPYLGGEYPHNQPLSWHTESVTIGGRELLPAAPPARWHSDHRFEYRFGTVTEVYDVLAEGLEQSFVVHGAPSVRGDLVVTGAVNTALAAAPRDAQHGPLDFRDGSGNPILRYGAAIAFDATGARVRVATAYRDGRISLSVPGSWLENAVFPVTVDPLLARRMVSSPRVVASPDVARDETADQIMVGFTRAASAGDWDAFGLIVSDDFNLTRQVLADATSTWDTRRIRVASSGGQKWCAVIERRFTAGARAVRYQLRNSGDLTFRTSFNTFAAPLGSHDWRPDVGGVLPGFAVQPRFAIVYQQEVSGLRFQNIGNSRVVGRMLDGGGVLGGQFTIATSALRDYERPTINQQTSPGTLRQPTYWMVTYQGYTNSGSLDDWDLYGRLIESGSRIVPRTWLATETAPQPHHRLAPHIAGSGGRYFVVYTRSSLGRVAFKTPDAWGHEVYGQRVDWLPGSNPVNHPERLQYSSNRQEYLVGGCGYDHNTRSHWAFTVQSIRVFGGNGSVTYRRVGFRGITTEGGLVDSAVPPAQGVAGGVTFDGENDLFPLAWCMSSSGTGSAWVSKIGYLLPFPIARLGQSCSSAQDDWYGSQQIGDEFTGVRLSGAPPSTLAFLLVGLSQTNMDLSGLRMPGCRLLVPNSGPGYVGLGITTTNTAGNARFALPLPEFLQTDDLYFQWFHVAPGLNPANLASTRGLRVQVVR